MSEARSHNLPPIPLRRVEGAGSLLEAEGARLNALLAGASRTYPDLLIRFGDRVSRRWLQRTGNPYLEEIEDTTPRDKADRLIRIEGDIRGRDPRIHTENFTYRDQVTTVHLESTRGY